jgi:hypothetical protein
MSSGEGSLLIRPNSSLPVGYIQGVPGVTVSILGGHSIGHSMQKEVHMYMCPIPNGFRDRAISLYSSRTIDKRYYVLFLIPVFIVQVTKLVQFT